MMVAMRPALAAIRRVIDNPDMRRALAGWMLGWAAEWAWLVALLVYAYGAGGLGVVGFVGLARTLPAAILAPALGSLADRFPRHRVLLAIHAGRCALLGIAALVTATDGPPVFVYLIAALDAFLAVLHRPTHMALLPSLARSPEQLVGANVASSTVEAVGILAGPAVGAFTIATGIVPLTFGVPACIFAIAALSVWGLHLRSDRPQAEAMPDRSVLRGLRALRTQPYAALVIGLFSAQTIVRGAMSVLIVAGAVEMLGMGEEGVGFLNAAIGAGGLVGAVSAMSVVGRRRMAPAFLVGLLLWGGPIVVSGLLPAAAVALLAMGVVGAGNAVLDVSGFTLLQRIVPNAARGSVFGVLEAMVMLTVGLGALVAPLVVELAGVRGAWIAVGTILPLLALGSWRAMSHADAQGVIPDRELGLLRGVPMLRVLPLTVLEQVAADLRPMGFAAGEGIIHRGEVGDRFYVIAAGEVEVRVGNRVMRRQGAGESFGEVALLRDVRRTADVYALTDVQLYAMDRVAFRCAVTGDRQSREAADDVVGSRLAAG
jgi:MFS family permease